MGGPAAVIPRSADVPLVLTEDGEEREARREVPPAADQGRLGSERQLQGRVEARRGEVKLGAGGFGGSAAGDPHERRGQQVDDVEACLSLGAPTGFVGGGAEGA